jgi:hypothetical protein
MADNEKGGLSSVDPMASFSQRLQAQTTESQKVLDEHRKRLMDLMSSRQQMPFDPAMMSLAAGLLSPTKTGGFGESLAAGMTGYATETEKQFRRQQEEAKLGYELEMAAQDQKRKMMGQQFFGELASRKKTTLAPSSATATSAEAPAVVPAAATSAVPSDAPNAPPAAAVRSTEAPAVAAPAASKSPDQVLAQVNANDSQIKNLLKKIQSSGSDAFADVSNEEIAMLEMYSPEYAKMINSYRDAVNKGTTLDVSRLNAFVAASKLELDKVQEIRNQAELDLKRKKSGFEEREVESKEQSIKRNLPGVGTTEMPLNFWKSLDAAENFDAVQKLYKKFNLPLNTTVGTDGQLRFMTPSEIEVKKEREQARFTQSPVKRPIPELGAGTFEINPIDYSDYQAAKRKGPDALQLWFNQSEFSGQGIKIQGAKIGNFGAETKVQSIEERGVEDARLKRLAEKEAENTIALDGTIRNAGRQADSFIQNSDNLLDLMNKPEYSGAWGMFSGPGVKNAAVRFISSGIDVGNFRVGIPAFESALKQAKMTDAQIEATVRAMQIYGEQKLQIARRDLAGEGSVSDGERRLVGDVSGSTDTPLKSAMAIAELFKYRGEFDKKNATLYNQWRDKNPAMAGNRYFDTDEYRALVKGYDGVMNDLRQKYYPSKAKPTAKSESPPSNTAPAKKGKENPYLQGQ